MARVLPPVARLTGMALNLLFPPRCVGCGREGEFVCHSCAVMMPRITPPFCPVCGRSQPSGILCPDCVNWQTQLDGIRSPFRFEGVIRQAIYQLKYRNLRAAAGFLAGLLHEYLLAYPVTGEVLVPVPLHRKRLRERGYNQSALLARELGRLTVLPTVDDCLIRQRPALPQARTASAEERRSNVTESFTCLDRRLEGKQVLLIDDVATSGATLDACAAALKSAGAASVWGLTLSREM